MALATTISLVNQKGGVGKSTIAVNLAVELSKIYKTMLVDCDPMRSCIDFSNARSELLGEMNDLTVCGKSFVAGKSIGENGETINLRGEELSPKAIRQELKTFKEDYEVIIVDSPGKTGKIGQAIASVSDLVIVPVIPGYFDAWGSDGTFEALEEIMAYNDLLEVRMLINRRDDRTNLSRDLAVFAQDRMQVMQTTLGNRTIYGQSAAGQSVVELDHRSAAANEMTELVKEIEGILNMKKQEVKK
jgi:chromosome partitioning protein